MVLNVNARRKLAILSSGFRIERNSRIQCEILTVMSKSYIAFCKLWPLDKVGFRIIRTEVLICCLDRVLTTTCSILNALEFVRENKNFTIIFWGKIEFIIYRLFYRISSNFFRLSLTLRNK